MGRQKKPTAHLELVGAFKKDPQRKRDSEPVCNEPIGPAPARLTDIQREAWDYLVDSARDVPGLFTRLDRAFLQMCSMALAAIWEYDPEARGKKQLSVNALNTVGSMLGKLGMTPSERSNVIVPKQKEANPFSEFTKA